MEDVAVEVFVEDLPGHIPGPMPRLVDECHPRVGVSARGDADHGTFLNTFHATSVENCLRLALFGRWIQTSISRLNASVQSASVMSPQLPQKRGAMRMIIETAPCRDP